MRENHVMAGRMAEMRCRKGRNAPGGKMQQSPCCSAPVPVHARTGRIGKGNRRIRPADMRMADGASLESGETRGKPGCRQICGQPKSLENIV
ncbi:MAG: hypothetical protein C6P37_03530 [Caldibacillus debilis]|uniref:Uncharacterized protein n=1 Tax=Caldibacillus debilis TaxID=301148 RepID=A0A3E0K7V5_9BACI|nr:MAG: hypothetical protein C6P37_03530 [Caldibacillus debilis]